MSDNFSKYFTRTNWQFDIEKMNRELKPFEWVFHKYPSTTGNQLINLNCLENAVSEEDQLTDNRFFFDAARVDERVKNWNKNRSICNSKKSIWTKIPNIWKGTYWEKISTILPCDGIGRTRFFYKPASTAGLIHIDESIRYHLVLKTNPDCFIVLKSPDSHEAEFYHIPCDGYVYKFRANIKEHFGLNIGNTSRTHLVWNSDELE